MKKLLFVIVAEMLAGQAWVQRFTVGNFEYTVTSGTNVSVKEASDNISGDITIPSEVTYPQTGGVVYSVTSIGDYAFNGCIGLTSIEIPNSVTSIGAYAFDGCDNIKTLTYNTNAVTNQFAGKSSIETINIGNSVTIIGNNAFEGCSGLSSIIIPNSVTSIGDNAFSGCTGLTSIEIPNSVTSIGTHAFFYCTGLTSVTIPESVTSIGYDVFSCCNNIKTLTYNTNAVTNQFMGINSIETINIGNSVTSIPNGAFYNCTGLTSVEIPNSVTSIGDCAFSDCSELTSITIPESVISIGEDAFRYCQNATLYCQAESKPSGWDWWWNSDYRPVKWNCKVIKLTVNNPEQGSAEVSGYAVKTADGSMWYLYNSQAVFSAMPDNGYHVRWDDGGTDNNRTIAITENKTYTATFEMHTEVDAARLEATCITDGHEAGKCCSVCNAVLDGMEVIPALHHSFGTPTYVWAEDGRSCAATVVCQRNASHVVTENASVSSAVTVAATCENMGTTTYTAVFENELFTAQTKDVADVAALNHSYGIPEYVWSEDGSSCTATTVCRRDASHVVTENATITNNVTIPATCEDKGTTTYTATFENALFKMQTKAVVNIPANGHTEVVDEAVAPTCTGMGKTEGRHCSVCGKIFAEQKNIAALNHNYGEPSYEWSEDGHWCIATAVCQRDANHVMTEDAMINSWTTAATCEREGSTTYMAEFETELFESQTKTIADVPALGHNYLLPIYAWSANGSSCAAMAICLHDATHTVTENATVTSEVTIAATCEGMGATTHTASFENEVFETQTKVVVDLPALGHIVVVDDAVAATCESYGLTEGSHCSVCGHVFKAPNILPALPHTEVVDAAVEPTCTVAGKTEGKHCDVCGTVLQAQERIPALGHTVEIDLAVPATCTVTGCTDGRHCAVCNTVLVAQKEVPAFGHEFGEYVYNNDATTEADGTETALCRHGCGTKDTRVAVGTRLSEVPGSVTAVAENAANAVNIYAHHNIIVVENAEDDIIVYNAMGKLVFREANRRVRAEINVSGAGVYIVKTGSKTQKIVIQ